MPSGAQARRRRKEKGKSDFFFPSPDAATMVFAIVATKQSTCGGAAIQTIYLHAWARMSIRMRMRST